MMAAPLFLNKAVVSLFAVAKPRESVAEGAYLGVRPSSFTGMEWISAPIAELIKITLFCRT